MFVFGSAGGGECREGCAQGWEEAVESCGQGVGRGEPRTAADAVAVASSTDTHGLSFGRGPPTYALCRADLLALSTFISFYRSKVFYPSKLYG